MLDLGALLGQNQTVPQPSSTPPLEFPPDWDHKSCPVWEYKPAPPKTDEAILPIKQDLQEKDNATTAGPAEKKRVYHKYEDQVL